jgi:hypothetical protein
MKENNMLSLKSHSKEDILKAFSIGIGAYVLDTDTNGEDDVLLGDRSDVILDILSYHELETLPSNWNLTKICKEEFLKRMENL